MSNLIYKKSAAALDIQKDGDRCDPIYGAAVRCKKLRRFVGLRSCINVSGLWLERAVLRAIMAISAHTFSLNCRPRAGHCGLQISHAPRRPILHLV